MAAIERLVDLAPEVAHVHLDDVRLVVERPVPHVIEQLAFRDRLTDAPHECLEQRELARGELDLRVPAKHPCFAMGCRWIVCSNRDPRSRTRVQLTRCAASWPAAHRPSY